MTTDLGLIDVQVQVPARAAATAWLNAFLAASDDEDRRILYKTLSVEFFDTGVQFIGCDGTALFRCWVPTVEGKPWPELEEVPDRAIVAMDVDGFAKAFMSGVVRATAEREHEVMLISTAPNDNEATLPLGAEFMSERLTLRAVGQRIDLPIMEGVDYPGWRHLNLGVEPSERVEGLRMQTRLLGLLGKLKNISAVELEFHGENRRVEFSAPWDNVRGMLMPMRRVSKAEKSEEKAS